MTQAVVVVQRQGKALNRCSRYAKRSGYISYCSEKLLDRLESKFWVRETLKQVKLVWFLTKARMVLCIKVLRNRIPRLSNSFSEQ